MKTKKVVKKAVKKAVAKAAKKVVAAIKAPALLPLPDRQKRAKYVGAQLEKLFPNPAPPLHHTDAFTLLVAVSLSAQTTDALVNKVTPALFKAAPTPEAMAGLSEEAILKLIQSVNFSRTKARHLKKMAGLLVEKFGGEVPRTFEELESLPGVGHKTASVVMSQSFHVPAFPVDTHIHRLAMRWKLSNGKNVELTERDLKEVFPPESWEDLHLQIIYYGRSHCTARNCDGHTCMICRQLNGPKKA
jgi:endonuclease-3